MGGYLQPNKRLALLGQDANDVDGHAGRHGDQQKSDGFVPTALSGV